MIDLKMDQLGPCPFCDGTNCYVCADNYVICDDCGAYGPCPEPHSSDTAVSLWNDAAAVSKWKKQLEEFSKQLQPLLEVLDEPYPKPLPVTSDSRVDEVYAAVADDKARQEWKERHDKACEDMIAIIRDGIMK